MGKAYHRGGLLPGASEGSSRTTAGGNCGMRGAGKRAAIAVWRSGVGKWPVIKEPIYRFALFDTQKADGDGGFCRLDASS